MKFLFNTILAALIIATVTELSRRFNFLAALLISLPLTSLIALCFVYNETHDVAKVANLSMNIFWLVLPSLIFFLALPALLRNGFGFWTSMATSTVLLIAVYGAYAFALKRAGVEL